MKKLVLIALLFLVSDIYAVQDKKSDELKNFAGEIVACLTGWKAVEDSTALPDRFSQENKETARQYLYGVFKRIGLIPKKHRYSSTGVNIFAVLKATSASKEYILVGAHYDSKKNCPGANDNATGCAMVLAAARYLGRLKNRSANVIFVLFDEEEKGLLGSRAFAEKMQKEHFLLTQVHTIDQMGWDSDKDRAIELEVPFDGAVPLYQKAVRNLNLGITLHISPVTATDHNSFRKLGFKAVGLTEEFYNHDTTPYYHKPTDTFETVDLDYLAVAIKLLNEAIRLELQ